MPPVFFPQTQTAQKEKRVADPAGTPASVEVEVASEVGLPPSRLAEVLNSVQSDAN